jgi:hypothetical protein
MEMMMGCSTIYTGKIDVCTWKRRKRRRRREDEEEGKKRRGRKEGDVGVVVVDRQYQNIIIVSGPGLGVGIPRR